MATDAPAHSKDFVRDIVADDVKTNKWGGRVVTRFPPEPNGYLHIGHAKNGLGEVAERLGDRAAVRDGRNDVDGVGERVLHGLAGPLGHLRDRLKSWCGRSRQMHQKAVLSSVPRM